MLEAMVFDYYWTEEQERVRRRLRESPLDFMIQCYNKVDDDDPDLDVPRPTAVLEVIDLRHSSTITRNETSVTARCLCADGQERVLRCWHNCWGGGLIEPPDYSAGVEIVGSSLS